MSKEPPPPRENFPGGDVVPGEDELRVSIEKKAYAEILVHAKDESDVEVGGFLLGKVKEDKHGTWLHVQHTIRGEKLENQGAQVKFTHETWNLMYREKDKSYPGMDIVGWYHTHPGFDIFLSEMDKFIHDNWFSNPNQVAFVYDPHQGTEGFFRKPKSEIVLLGRFWHGGKMRKTLSPEQRIKPAASAGGTSGDVAATISALNESVRRLEIRGTSEPPLAGGWSGLMMTVMAGLTLFLLGWQLRGCPRAERVLITDPVTNTPVYLVDPRTGNAYSLELGPPEGRYPEPKPSEKKPGGAKPSDPKPPDAKLPDPKASEAKPPEPKPPDPKPPERK